MSIYELPDSIDELFANQETEYRIIDYNQSMEMDNIESMAFLLDHLDIKDENLELNDGTQVILYHSDYKEKLVIDSGGLGDFFSHKFEVSLYKE